MTSENIKLTPNYDRANQKYHYFYKITNKINNKFYYGVHSTDNLDDGYFGSGKALWRAIKKYGKDNFVKENLKFFDNPYDLLKYEREIVNEELIKDNNCYNIILGGGFSTVGLITAKDKENNYCLVPKDDIRLLSGELYSWSKNKTTVKDKDGNTFSVDINDERLKTGELVGIRKNKITAKNIYTGETLSVSKDDPRWISGELVGINKGYSPSKETKEKHAKSWGKRKRIFKGNENKIIKIEDLQSWVDKGWEIGISPMYKKNMSKSSLGYKWINNGIENKNIPGDKFEEYINNGWKKGRLKK